MGRRQLLVRCAAAGLGWLLLVTGHVVVARDCRIKGNISHRGERIYHLPGSRWYADTRIDPRRGERWFCSEEEALRAGWRPPLDQPLSPVARRLLEQRGKSQALMGAAALPLLRRARRRALAGGLTAPAAGCLVKGNINRRGECIYHVPGSRWYARTVISPGKGERWFCSVQEAIAAGCRAPRR